MKTLSLLFAALLSIAGGVVYADELETLAPATALAEIQKTRGVVFVDLYADW